MDAYGDVIANGAFTKTIADFKTSGVWPAMLSQHGGWDMSAESLTPIGVWTEMREDEHGCTSRQAWRIRREAARCTRS